MHFHTLPVYFRLADPAAVAAEADLAAHLPAAGISPSTNSSLISPPRRQH